jgi:spermidine synthase
MAGVIGALLHPNPRSAMIVGLGTGTTAGWLAGVASMQRVDVVELESAVVRLTREYASVNRGALDNPRVHVTVGDARETLLVSRKQYDIIFSEPSNPYRAGVASLYTREFYQAAGERLAPGGIFAQWVQTYSIDAQTARTIYATVASVFPHVQTWTTNPGDVVLIASREPIAMDVDTIRRRIGQEPFRTATHVAWRVETAEGVLAHFVAAENVAAAFARGARELNTDDRPVIEFAFARSLGRDSFGTADIAAAAERLHGGRPRRIHGAVDWDAVAANRATIAYLPSTDARNEFARMYAAAEFGHAARAWDAQRWNPVSSRQLAMVAHVLAVVGDERALAAAAELRPWEPAEADAIMGILRFRQQRTSEAVEPIARALTRYRGDPWPLRPVMESALAAAAEIAADPRYAPVMLDALSRPYAARQLEEVRRLAYVAAAWRSSECSSRTVEALARLEPHVPWVREILQMRVRCYMSPELATRASRELAEYQQSEAKDVVRMAAR